MSRGYTVRVGDAGVLTQKPRPDSTEWSLVHQRHMQEHYLDDLYVGQTFGTPSLTVSAEAIKAFAQQFDFQPFHLYQEAAKSTFFGELVASGCHTDCLTMKLLLEGDYRPAGGVIGGKEDELRWPNPTRPGDVLTCTTEILEIRPSATRPGQGTVKMRTTSFNASKEVVYILVMNGIAHRGELAHAQECLPWRG